MKIGTILLLVALAAFHLTACGQRKEAETAPAASEPVVAAAATESLWMTDFEAATEKSHAEKKVMLLDFTGSDWCGWCVKLKKEVFTQPEFIAYAEQNLVLVMLDFPRKPQSEQLKAQNQKLQRQFGIRGFPTIVLLDLEGKELARTGYRQGGAAAYVEHLKELMHAKK